MLSRKLVAATMEPMMLSILSDGDMYGYEIIRRIQNISDGKVRWTTGTLYPLLHRMEASSLVKSTWRDGADAPKRKYYRLTRKGRRALEREKSQWVDANDIFSKLWELSSQPSTTQDA